MKKATFRIIRFVKVNRYVAIAWNYDEAVLIASSDHSSYTDARRELDTLCSERNVKLQWFDGSYECAGEGEQLLPVESDLVPCD